MGQCFSSNQPQRPPNPTHMRVVIRMIDPSRSIQAAVIAGITETGRTELEYTDVDGLMTFTGMMDRSSVLKAIAKFRRVSDIQSFEM